MDETRADAERAFRALARYGQLGVPPRTVTQHSGLSSERTLAALLYLVADGRVIIEDGLWRVIP